MEEITTNQQEIDFLLDEYKEQRASLKGMVVDLEELKKNITEIFPKDLDKRYIRFFEEKVKTATNLYNSILDIRKELSRILKDEIELRRKIELKQLEDDDKEIDFDLRSIARKVEDLSETRIEESKGDDD